MKFVEVLLGILFASISTAVAVIFEKNCVIFEESYNFNEHRFTGVWYEIRRLYDPDGIEQEECVQEQYARTKNSDDFNIIRSAQTGATGEPTYSTGAASPRSFHNSKVPQFYFRYNTTGSAEPDMLMDIVQTDYLNYAIMYSCNPVNTTTVSENAWILSRRPTVSKPAAEMINKFVAAHFNHPKHTWRVTEQAEGFCKPTIFKNGALRSSSSVMIWPTVVQLVFVYLLAKLVL